MGEASGSVPGVRARKWLAWKLQMLAQRLYDSYWHEEIVIESPAGQTVRICVTGDDYGCGISSIGGVQWHLGNDWPMTGELDGWKFTWPDAVRLEDYLDALGESD